MEKLDLYFVVNSSPNDKVSELSDQVHKGPLVFVYKMQVSKKNKKKTCRIVADLSWTRKLCI